MTLKCPFELGFLFIQLVEREGMSLDFEMNLLKFVNIMFSFVTSFFVVGASIRMTTSHLFEFS